MGDFLKIFVAFSENLNAHSELISTHISGAEVFGSCLSDYLLGKLGCDLHDAR